MLSIEEHRKGRRNVRPEPAETFFDRSAEAFSSNYHRAPEFQERREVITRVVNDLAGQLPADAVGLDLGCGDATLSLVLSDVVATVVGFDQSETMLERARCRVAGKGVSQRMEFHHVSLPIPEPLEFRYRNAASLILCSSVLEYLSDYQAVLQQCHRLLGTGGLLIVTVPNRASMFRWLDRARQRIGLAEASYLHHQRHQFTLPGLTGVLSSIGFLPIRSTFFALPLQRWSGKLFGAYRGHRLATMLLVASRKVA
jgi:SAM-dependent methyltransferase